MDTVQCGMVLGFITPGYDWVARYGSELSLGLLGWIMIANFIVLGLWNLLSRWPWAV